MSKGLARLEAWYASPMNVKAPGLDYDPNQKIAFRDQAGGQTDCLLLFKVHFQGIIDVPLCAVLKLTSVSVITCCRGFSNPHSLLFLRMLTKYSSLDSAERIWTSLDIWRQHIPQLAHSAIIDSTLYTTEVCVAVCG